MILGIDEVGRGPWAGPLVMGACILHDTPREEWQDRLTDSKNLTARQREQLEPLILAEAAAYGLGWVSAEELDKVGLSTALRLACRRAVEAVQKTSVPFHEIIIDGTVNFLAQTTLGSYVTTLKKADLLVKEVSAAAIIAKVARDRYMVELAKKYPGYGFESHVGYGTKLHREALAALGPCAEHRKSFRPVAQLLPKVETAPSVAPTSPRDASPYLTATARGQRAESVAADWLAANGHTVLARNYKTKFYEIDIISSKNNVVYFTEVKYRQNSNCGSPLAAITPTKLRQMSFAAESFLHRHKLHLPPKLAAAEVQGSDYKLKQWFPLEAT